MMSSFPQPLPDKSLVNWDIRGARAKYIEKEVKLYERESKSPPIPMKKPEDYVVNTRHGPNPNVQRARQPNIEVNMPQGSSAFDIGGRKHYIVNQGEIREKRSLENPFNLPSTYEFIQPYYPRSLNVQDIDGTNPGSLGNKVVKNKEQASKIIAKEQIELKELSELQKNPYERYQDALDKFKREMNAGQGEFRDRYHYITNPDNPYAPVDHPKYQQGSVNAKKEPVSSNSVLDKAAEKEYYQDRRSEDLRRQQEEEESYKPRQFREENKSQLVNNSRVSKEQEQKDYQRYQDYLREQEYEKIKREYEQEKELERKQEKSYPQNDNNDYQRSREIGLLRGQNEQQFSKKEYKDDDYNQREIKRQPSPDFEKRMGIQSSYKSQPNLLKLNQQSEIISHAINNISPQITKQNLGPNLNLEGYVNYGKGARLNPTSMSYVGTELANKNITLTHNLLGNQIYLKEKQQRAVQRDSQRYANTQLNFQKFEKYPGEFMDILHAQGKAPTNENLFQLQYERANAPKSTMESLLKYPVNVYGKGEGNLDHFKKDSNPIPVQQELPPDYVPSIRNSAVHFQNDEPRDVISNRGKAPFGAPFSYNPNEYKKQEMVALNHSKQLEKIEQSIDNVDKKIDNIQRDSPDIQQPHIKKTLNPEHYMEIMNQIRAEEEEKAKHKDYQRFLQSNHEKESFAGMGSYGDYSRQRGYEPKSNYQSEEYIKQYGAKGLRNLSNVRIF